jgi:hypothetical protein
VQGRRSKGRRPAASGAARPCSVHASPPTDRRRDASPWTATRGQRPSLGSSRTLDRAALSRLGDYRSSRLPRVSLTCAPKSSLSSGCVFKPCAALASTRLDRHSDAHDSLRCADATSSMVTDAAERMQPFAGASIRGGLVGRVGIEPTTLGLKVRSGASLATCHSPRRDLTSIRFGTVQYCLAVLLWLADRFAAASVPASLKSHHYESPQTVPAVPV